MVLPPRYPMSTLSEQLSRCPAPASSGRDAPAWPVSGLRPGGSDTSGELDKPVTPDLTHASLGSTLSGDIVYVLSLILFK